MIYKTTEAVISSKTKILKGFVKVLKRPRKNESLES
jgi:hypothetical protein